MQAAFLKLWLLIRVPLLILLFIFLKDWLIARFTRDEVWITLSAIDIMSTPASRCLIALSFGMLVFLSMVVVRGCSAPFRWLAPTATALVLYGLIWEQGGGPSQAFVDIGNWALVAAALIAAINFLPSALLPRPNIVATSVTCLPVVSELLGFRFYLATLFGGKAPSRLLMNDRAALGAATAVLVPSFIAALLANGHALVQWEQAMRSPPSLRIVAKGDFNGVGLDRSGNTLFVAGHGIPGIARLDLQQPDATLQVSSVDAGGPENFEYDPVASEIYLFDGDRQEVLYLDADTLQLKRSLSVSDISSGDVWMVANHATDTLTIGSEANEKQGVPFVVLNRTTGIIEDRRNYGAGSRAVHPSKPLIYMTFFRRRQSLLVYDLATRQLAAEVPTRPRADRVAFLQSPDEVVVAQPEISRLLRFDADTLEPLGEIETTFGVRVAIGDPARQLILTASIATGELDVIDRTSGKSLRRFYLGPWLRSIAISPERGTAYVSSNGALFELQYAEPLSAQSPPQGNRHDARSQSVARSNSELSQ